MFIGGQLIKEFDAFLHLFLSAADALHSHIEVPAEDQFALNRVLAGLGGPPAAAEVRLSLQSAASLPILCLFLLMHKEHCPIGLGEPEPLARLKQFTHIVAHAMVPMATGGGEALQVEEVTAALTETTLALQPMVTYNEDGEVAAVYRSGGANWLQLLPGGGPFKVIINPRGEAPLDRDGPLHPVVVHASWQERTLGFLKL